MAQLLPFILWPESGNPEFVRENTPFTDGTTIELASKASEFLGQNGADAEHIHFIISLLSDGNELAKHRFQMRDFKPGNNFWLIADPQKTQPNESFTTVFAEALVQLPAGQHSLIIQVAAEHHGEVNLLEEGELTFDTSKGTAYYESLAALLKDPDTARENGLEAFYKQQEAEQAKKEASKKSNHYKIKLKNSQSSLTTYVIYKDMRSLSEFIASVQPGSTTEIELNPGLTYDILSYLQDTNKEQARKITTVTKAHDGQEILV